MSARPPTLRAAVGLALACLVALGLAARRASRHDLRQHADIVERLAAVEQEHAVISQSVLELRFGLLSNYDATARAITRQKERLAELRRLLAPRRKSSIHAAMDEYGRRLEAQEGLITEFSTSNATLNNSLRYFPRLILEVSRALDAEPGQAATATRLRGLLRDVLLFCFSESGSHLEPRLHSERAWLSTADLGRASQNRRVLDRHLDLVLRYKRETDSLLLELLRSPAAEAARSVGREYQRLHEADVRAAKAQRLLLTLLSLALGVVVAASVMRLRAAVQALDEANAGLERRVDERTSELARVNEVLKIEVFERRQGELQLRAIYDSSMIGIFLADVSGDAAFINAAFSRISGLRLDESGQRENWLRVLHPEDRDRVMAEWQAAVAGGCEYASTHRFVRENGQVVWVSVKAAPLHDGERLIGYAGTAEDITKETGLERVVRQSEKMAAVGQLAAGVAHEINNPLGIILGFAQAALKRAASGDEALSLALRSIEREAVRCRGLVQDLLAFSRQGAGDKAPIDLNAAIGPALSLIGNQARVRKVALISALEPGLPSVVGSAGKLQQVVMNLATNALDAMPGGGTLTVRTSAGRWNDEAVVLLEVVDTGAGMTKDVAARVFEPFFTTKEVGKGTGLGLSLVHEIVRKHDGAISVSSEPGMGSRFVVRLPTGQGALSAARSARPAAAPAARPAPVRRAASSSG